MTPLKITARLRNGFATADPWSPAIDAILAYWHLMRELGAEQFALNSSDRTRMRPVRLPFLAIEEHAGRWWHVASMPLYEIAAKHRRYYHRRFDDHHDRYLDLTGKSGRVLTSAGPYKNYRRSTVQHICRAVEWHVIGDRSAIEPLLSRCHHIGSKRSQGMGRVRGWDIAEGDPDIARYRRPLPVDYARDHDITGPVMTWGIVPPGFILEAQAPCVMPR